MGMHSLVGKIIGAFIVESIKTHDDLGKLTVVVSRVDDDQHQPSKCSLMLADISHYSPDGRRSLYRDACRCDCDCIYVCRTVAVATVFGEELQLISEAETEAKKACFGGPAPWEYGEEYKIQFDTVFPANSWVNDLLKRYDDQIKKVAVWAVSTQDVFPLHEPKPTKCKYNARDNLYGPQHCILVNSPHWAESDKHRNLSGYYAARAHEMALALEVSRRSILRTMRELPWCVERNRQVSLVVHKGLLAWHCEPCHGKLESSNA